jgi:hypothetical protein
VNQNRVEPLKLKIIMQQLRIIMQADSEFHPQIVERLQKSAGVQNTIRFPLRPLQAPLSGGGMHLAGAKPEGVKQIQPPLATLHRYAVYAR